MAEKYNEVANRLVSTRSAAEDPSIDHIVTGANAVYDDTVPYRYNGHIDCKEITPIGTENPQELEWYEKVYNALAPTLFEWVKTTDTSVDSEKTYGVSIGAKQSDVNRQLYERLDDIYEVTINADEVNKVITSDPNKIINKENGYVPTAAAVGGALGANFEDSLTSTSIVKGLTANMGRELNETKANKNGWYEQLVSGASLSLIGDDVDHKATFLERETGDSTATGGTNHSVDKGTATIETIYGHTEKFNQLVRTLNPRPEVNGITRIINGNALHYSGTSTVTTNYTGIANFYGINEGHVYYVAAKGLPLDCALSVISQSNVDSTVARASTASAIPTLGIRIPAGITVDNDVYFNVIDLTAIFGADNEPATVAEFEAWLANNIGTQDYYDYTLGTLISLNPDSLVSTGFNQWDEEWEVGGYANANGEKYNTSDRIRSKNFIRVFPSTQYYFNIPNTIYVFKYDANKNYLGYSTVDYQVFTMPDNCHFINIVNTATTTYNNDICINLSDSAKNGTYMPYMKPSTVDLSWIKDIPDPNDSSKKLFPYGLLKAGNVCDEVTATKAIKRIGSVDLGTLNWGGNTIFYSNAIPDSTIKSGITCICSKYEAIPNVTSSSQVLDKSIAFNSQTIYCRDTDYSTYADFKASLNGVPLYYELATPIEVTFEEPNTHPMNYEVEDGGREKMLPENTSTPTTTSLVADIRYPLNALEAIRNLQNNFSTQGALYQTFNSLCSALNSAITTGTFAVAPDETVVGKFNFTFTPTENTQSVESNETI